MIEFISDMVRFMRVYRNYWLAPIVIILVLLGGLLLITEGSVIAPFIYTLF